MTEPETPADDMVTLTLPRDAAIVAFDVIARLADPPDAELQSARFGHPAEPAALWTLVAAFEQVLSAPFAEDYRGELEAARARLFQEITGEDIAEGS
ncbi:hypothetical protein [Xanthobacter tagetidis]|uniref:Uncharacterized protein n=1 Tax=Xanthobacter tagetidis TaxID=60216 RepID=A0A3L7A2K3_9HYPH|nr:hypothetical protein [Xanthobacter tagetidis]MBB6309259.1 hypothetical protein [Xanthobacter tagetidis]RLP74215.1 hypothetical protein D9R14_19350 [Xanthobacter tagetidis]